MAWRRKEPGHQQTWCWPSAEYTRIITTSAPESLIWMNHSQELFLIPTSKKKTRVCFHWRALDKVIKCNISPYQCTGVSPPPPFMNRYIISESFKICLTKSYFGGNKRTNAYAPRRDGLFMLLAVLVTHPKISQNIYNRRLIAHPWGKTWGFICEFKVWCTIVVVVLLAISYYIWPRFYGTVLNWLWGTFHIRIHTRPADTWHNNNVIFTSKWRFDVI